ncbi:hypothetical protein CPK_ORF00342 [Chlamydia pneumoniae LPCoLN]|nr:hypothetical protein CPK_ORF00342 [Chlamydia pneumoniae LPCoLN]
MVVQLLFYFHRWIYIVDHSESFEDSDIPVHSMYVSKKFKKNIHF